MTNILIQEPPLQTLIGEQKETSNQLKTKVNADLAGPSQLFGALESCSAIFASSLLSLSE